jgi:glycosyltransferase involved in cell wall biosynthesis
MSGPTVSVIIPTRNRHNLVGGAIESILRQTFEDFEIVVVDDASDDDTSTVLTAFADRDSRVRPFRTDRTLGCNGARNLGISRAGGRYVAFLDDDDRAAPERLARTVRAFGESPMTGVVCTSYLFIDARGEKQPWAPPPPAFCSHLTDPDAAFERLYCDWAWLPTSSFAVSAELLSRHLYPEIRRCDGDSILYSQLAATGTSFLLLPDRLAYVCREDSYDRMSGNMAKLFADRRRSLRYIRRWLSGKGINKYDHLHARAWSNHLLREADFRGGLRGFLLAAWAFRTQPSNAKARDYFWSRVRSASKSVLKTIFPMRDD